MKVPLQYAVMSFCPDLTDPEAVARPVAIVGAGRLYVPRGRRKDFAFYVVRNQPGTDLALPQNKLSQSILSGLPALFDREIADGAGVGMVGLLPWLHNKFRNSLHVASVHQATIQAKDPLELQSACVRLYLNQVLQLRLGRPQPGSKEDRRRRSAPAPEAAFQLDEGYAYKFQPLEARALQAVG